MHSTNDNYMWEQIREILWLLRNKDEFSVDQLARLAGCSTSLIYKWCNNEGYARADFLFQLAESLAERHRNYRLIHLLLPLGVRLVTRTGSHTANGTLDELEDSALAIAEIVHSVNNPERLEKTARLYHDLGDRLDVEAQALRGKLKKVG